MKIAVFGNAQKEPAQSLEPMPAEFGLPTATFVVVAGMVGAGVLTTSGFTVARVGSNEWMLILWIIGGITAVCGALTIAELSAAPAANGWRLRLLARGIRAFTGIFVGLGLILDRIRRSDRGIGVSVLQVHSCSIRKC